MSMMDSFANIPEHQKADFLQHLENYQLKDSLKMYSNTVDLCFDKCVSVGWGGAGLRSKNLEETEERCLSVCAEKFLKITQRTGFRFSEYQAAKSVEEAP